MRVTGFIFNLSQGGAQGVFVTVMNYLYQNGYEVNIVTQNLKNAVHLNSLDKGINVISLNTFSAKKSLTALTNYVKNNSIECALVFGPELCVNLYLAKCICRKNFIIIGRSINTISIEFKYEESFFRKYITHALIKIFFHKIDYVIAQSKNMGNDLIENYHFKKMQVSVINNALSKKYEEEILNLCNDERSGYFLYVGRLEKQKGLPMLLHAFEQVKNKTMRLILLGDGSQRNFLEKMARELNIENRVEFLGYAQQTLQYYKNANAVVLSSYFEGFPNVLIEALSCGTPIVSYDLPSGPDEIIIQGKNGYLVEYCNVRKLTDALELTLNTKWDYLGIKNTAKRYTSSYILKKYIDLLIKCEENMVRMEL